jgi:hypothetical protein
VATRITLELQTNFKKKFDELHALTAKLGVDAAKPFDEILKDLDQMSDKLKAVGSATGGWKDMFKGIGLERMAEKGLEMGKEMIAFSFESLKNWNKQKDVIKTFISDSFMAEKQLTELREIGGGIMPLEEMTEAYKKLRNMGIDPTAKQMKAMADIAKSQNRSVGELGHSVAAALAGHYRALMEYGIHIEKVGDKLKGTFRGITTDINAAGGMMNYVTDVIGQSQGVAGAVEHTNPLERAQGLYKESLENAGKALALALEPHFTTFLDHLSRTLDRIPELVHQDKASQETTAVEDATSLFGRMRKAESMGYTASAAAFKQEIIDKYKDEFKGVNMDDKAAVDARIVLLENEAIYQEKYQESIKAAKVLNNTITDNMRDLDASDKNLLNDLKMIAKMPGTALNEAAKAAGLTPEQYVSRTSMQPGGIPSMIYTAGGTTGTTANNPNQMGYSLEKGGVMQWMTNPKLFYDTIEGAFKKLETTNLETKYFKGIVDSLDTTIHGGTDTTTTGKPGGGDNEDEMHKLETSTNLKQLTINIGVGVKVEKGAIETQTLPQSVTELEAAFSKLVRTTIINAGTGDYLK